MLAIYFLVLLTQTLLERELRRAMARAELPSLPLYPEGRPCTRPTAPKILELFEPIQRKRFSQLKTDFAVAPVYLKSGRPNKDTQYVKQTRPGYSLA